MTKGPTDIRLKQSKKAIEKMQSRKKEEKITTVELYDLIAKAIDREPGQLKVPFPNKYGVVEPNRGVRKVLYVDDNNIVSYCNEDAVSQDILKYTRFLGGEYNNLRFTYKRCQEAMMYWKNVSPPLPLPESILEKSNPDHCFHRLPFDLQTDVNKLDNEKLKPWMEILERCTNVEAFCCFIGSLFVSGSDRQQYLYIHGDGQNGKGSLVAVLSELMGSAFHSDDPAYADSRFWTYPFIGKRLIVFPDTNRPTFAQTGLFKSLTGNDPIRFEEKHHGTFTATLGCKFVFLSNEKLLISSKKADLRRAIYVKMDEITQELIPTDTYHHILMDSAEDFISYCVLTYKETCPNHETMPVDNSGLELAEEYEEMYHWFLREYFEVPSQAQLNRDLDQKDKSLCVYKFPSEDLQRAFRRAKITNPREQSKLKDWLKRKHQIECRQIRFGMDRARYYFGAKVRGILP